MEKKYSKKMPNLEKNPKCVSNEKNFKKTLKSMCAFKNRAKSSKKLVKKTTPCPIEVENNNTDAER